MSDLYTAIWIELRKAIRSKIPLFTMAGFMIMPLACSFMMFIYKDPVFARSLGLISAKAELIGGTADWPFYLSMLAQGTAIGGIMLFSIIESWVFGREFVDGTVKDLLAVPVSRGPILIAKFIVAAIWSIALIIVTYIISLISGALIDLPLGTPEVIVNGSITLAITACMVIIAVMPIAFFASAGRGYLLPFGIAILLVMLSSIIATIGYGNYFPWAVPALFAGMSNKDAVLEPASYLMVFLTGLAGIAGTYLWWKYADQSH